MIMINFGIRHHDTALSVLGYIFGLYTTFLGQMLRRFAGWVWE